jgi:hypothetical protein
LRPPATLLRFSLAARLAYTPYAMCRAPIVVTSMAQAGQFVLHGMLTAFPPIYAVEQVGLSRAEAGLLFGAQLVATILTRPLFGRVSTLSDVAR